MTLFEHAVRQQIAFKGALQGPPGSGKTYTMLHLLHSLSPGRRPLVICSERGRILKYASRNGWDFDRYFPTTFDPADVPEIIASASAQGYTAIGLDSLTHWWSGIAGMLEQVDIRTAAASSSNKFGVGWKDMRPVERRMWDAILGTEMHVVATLRVKTAYLMEEIDNARGGRSTSPRKVGLKADQREGFDYEFDIVGELDIDNNLTIVKTDIEPIGQGAVYAKPGPELGVLIAEFCNEGEPHAKPSDIRERALDPAQTFETLGDLLREVRDAQLGEALILGTDGRAVALERFIIDLGKALASASVEQPAATVPAPRMAANEQAVDEPASSAARAAREVTMRWVLFVLKASHVDEAAENDTKHVQAKPWAAKTNVIEFLSQDVRGRLGIEPDRDVVTFAELGPMVVKYTGRHKESPLTPLDIDETPDSPMPHEPAAEESPADDEPAAGEPETPPQQSRAEQVLAEAEAAMTARRARLQQEVVTDSADLPDEPAPDVEPWDRDRQPAAVAGS